MKGRKPLQLSALILGLTGLLAAGCASRKPIPWNVVMTKSTTATVPVDIIGIKSADKTEWEGRNITQYWDPTSPGYRVREEADKIPCNLKLNEPTVVLDSSNPKWSEWFAHGVDQLLIIANLPGDPAAFASGAADPRRRFLLLAKKDWSPAKKNTIEITVKSTQISVETPQNAR